MNKFLKVFLVAMSSGLYCCSTSISIAAESGTALYIGGSQGFGAGSTPPPGFYNTLGFLYYDGTVDAVIDGGVIDLNVRKEAFATVLNSLYVFDDGFAGGRFGISASLPIASYTNLEASATGAIVGAIQTDGWGVGDLSIKAQNGWQNGNFTHTLSATVWAPTGRYDTGFQPNSGKNHVGFDFSWGATNKWADQNLELSVAAGYSVELENQATNYRNGDTAHFEAALGYYTQTGWTVGAAGYAIKQVTGDSGAGASLGSFKRTVYGLGPAISFSGLIKGKAVSISARHYREFGAENTFQGHITFATATVKF